MRWYPTSEVFDKARAIGLPVKDWQDAILVNMIGKRFYDETAGHFNYNTYRSTDPYLPHSYLNAKNQTYDPSNFINAALAGKPIRPVCNRSAQILGGREPRDRQRFRECGERRSSAPGA